MLHFRRKLIMNAGKLAGSGWLVGVAVSTVAIVSIILLRLAGPLPASLELIHLKALYICIIVLSTCYLFRIGAIVDSVVANSVVEIALAGLQM